MRNVVYYLVIGIFIIGILPVFSAPVIQIVPYPTKVIQGDGEFKLSSDSKIAFDEELKTVESFYKEVIESTLGFALDKGKINKSPISLRVDKGLKLPEEGYKLIVTPDKVEICASTPKGVFYGVQSLCQLISVNTGEKSACLPVVSIEDSPRFSWRGCMLDVSRTFMNKTLLKRYIDLMSYYKLNVLHLHLTDDQGWRIEIKRYPLLTSVGSKFDPEFNEMGGYYTQDDIRDLVQYASLRNITIVPEIELPGHECAAIAAYPELSCRGIRPKIHPFFMGTNIHNEIFCAGKPEVYEFVYNVIDEICTLFPSPYIHIGGDEAPKAEWKKCSHCQKTIKDNSLANEEELQSYFVTKVGDFIRKKGKILVGWDEIMVGWDENIDGNKLNGDEVLMYWRSWKDKEIKEAAQKGFKVISTPTSHCYFDYSYESIDTKKVYMYEPVPTDISAEAAANYIGIQANFWSHIDRSEYKIDKQLFPRLFALSEIAWSNSQNKDWKRFKRNAKLHSEKLRNNQVNCFYDKSVYNPE